MDLQRSRIPSSATCPTKAGDGNALSLFLLLGAWLLLVQCSLLVMRLLVCMLVVFTRSGISGGERKRLAFASEVLYSTVFMFIAAGHNSDIMHNTRVFSIVCVNKVFTSASSSSAVTSHFVVVGLCFPVCAMGFMICLLAGQSSCPNCRYCVVSAPSCCYCCPALTAGADGPQRVVRG